MEILKTQILRGPNFWSIKRTNLIQMKLDIGLYEKLPSNKLEGFTERLVEALPSLYSHRCSRGREGGFIERLHEGTWMGHIIEHVALELQCLAGMECGFGRTRSAGPTGVYHVVFSYLDEDAGVYAGKAAVRLVDALATGNEYKLDADLNELRRLYSERKLGPSTQGLVDEAQRRNIPCRRLDDNSLVMLGYGKNQRLLCATVTDSTSNIAVELVQDKEKVKEILSDAYIPVPKGATVETEEELIAEVNRLGYPMVVKPIDGNHGRGITTHISSEQQVIDAFILAKGVSEEVIVERHIRGNDYRLLVIDYKFVAASMRTPAMVTGDGRLTVGELIDRENQNVHRGNGHENILTKIEVELFLKDTANLSTGGTATDVTDLVHPQTKFIAERTARLLNLNICGIDLVAKDIAVPLAEQAGAILEVNAAPGFRMHQYPSSGLARNVAAPVIDMLYPPGAPSRIPLIAVTGTNGKTTTTRLTAHLAMCAGQQVGYTTTDGIYINKHLIADGDCSGPSSARTVLRDPAVDFAVLECARGGILRAGLGFDQCSISIVTNVADDHLGMDGIDDIETLARVKQVVPESTAEDGYAILNAEDERVFAMKEELSCQIALFGLDPQNPHIQHHCDQGGIAAYCSDGWIVVREGHRAQRIVRVKEVPITFEGKYDCMIQNALAATLAAVLSGFAITIIRNGLRSFNPSAQENPGRMNVYQLDHCQVLVDYAHNAAGYIELKKFMDKIKAPHKMGIIAATGDRRAEDIVALGELAAEIFDEIIIRHDRDGRGRSNEELSRLLMEGIKKKDVRKNVRVISDEHDALQYAIAGARPDSLIFVSCDDVRNTLYYVEKIRFQEEQNLKAYGT